MERSLFVLFIALLLLTGCGGSSGSSQTPSGPLFLELSLVGGKTFVNDSPEVIIAGLPKGRSVEMFLYRCDNENCPKDFDTATVLAQYSVVGNGSPVKVLMTTSWQDGNYLIRAQAGESVAELRIVYDSQPPVFVASEMPTVVVLEEEKNQFRENRLCNPGEPFRCPPLLNRSELTVSLMLSEAERSQAQGEIAAFSLSLYERIGQGREVLTTAPVAWNGGLEITIPLALRAVDSAAPDGRYSFRIQGLDAAGNAGDPGELGFFDLDRHQPEFLQGVAHGDTISMAFSDFSGLIPFDEEILNPCGFTLTEEGSERPLPIELIRVPYGDTLYVQLSLQGEKLTGDLEVSYSETKAWEDKQERICETAEEELAKPPQLLRDKAGNILSLDAVFAQLFNEPVLLGAELFRSSNEIRLYFSGGGSTEGGTEDSKKSIKFQDTAAKFYRAVSFVVDGERRSSDAFRLSQDVYIVENRVIMGFPLDGLPVAEESLVVEIAEGVLCYQDDSICEFANKKYPLNPEDYPLDLGRTKRPVFDYFKLHAGSNSGQSESDSITNVERPVIEVKSESGLKLLAAVTDNRRPLLNLVEQAPGIYILRYEENISFVPEGEHTIVLQMSDILGNQTEQKELRFTIDRQAPKALTGTRTGNIENGQFIFNVLEWRFDENLWLKDENKLGYCVGVSGSALASDCFEPLTVDLTPEDCRPQGDPETPEGCPILRFTFAESPGIPESAALYLRFREGALSDVAGNPFPATDLLYDSQLPRVESDDERHTVVARPQGTEIHLQFSEALNNGNEKDPAVSAWRVSSGGVEQEISWVEVEGTQVILHMKQPLPTDGGNLQVSYTRQLLAGNYLQDGDGNPVPAFNKQVKILDKPEISDAWLADRDLWIDFGYPVVEVNEQNNLKDRLLLALDDLVEFHPIALVNLPPSVGSVTASLQEGRLRLHFETAIPASDWIRVQITANSLRYDLDDAEGNDLIGALEDGGYAAVKLDARRPEIQLMRTRDEDGDGSYSVGDQLFLRWHEPLRYQTTPHHDWLPMGLAQPGEPYPENSAGLSRDAQDPLLVKYASFLSLNRANYAAQYRFRLTDSANSSNWQISIPADSAKDKADNAAAAATYERPALESLAEKLINPAPNTVDTGGRLKPAEDVASAFGWAQATGDFNGDGLTDWVLAAPGRINESAITAVTGANQVHLLFGYSDTGKIQYALDDATGNSQILEAPTPAPANPDESRFGHCLAVADFNNDQRDDLAVCAPGHQRIYIYYGGDQTRPANNPDVTVVADGTDGLAELGSCLAVFGDRKLALVAAANDMAAAGIYLLDFTTQQSAQWRLSNTTTTTLVASLSGLKTSEHCQLLFVEDDPSAGQLVLGLPHADLAAAPDPSNTDLWDDAGRLYLFQQDVNNPTAIWSQDLSLHGTMPKARFGHALLRGDGDDFWISAPGMMVADGQQAGVLYRLSWNGLQNTQQNMLDSAVRLRGNSGDKLGSSMGLMGDGNGGNHLLVAAPGGNSGGNSDDNGTGLLRGPYGSGGPGLGELYILYPDVFVQEAIDSRLLRHTQGRVLVGMGGNFGASMLTADKRVFVAAPVNNESFWFDFGD